MKRIFCWMLIIGSIIFLVMIGCAKKEGKEIKIGAILPLTLTGDNAVYGTAIQKGIELGLEEINKANVVNGVKS